MSQGEICVCYFVEILGESQPKVSRHLSYLRKSGLVAARRDGKWMHYSLVWPADAGQASVLDATLRATADDRQIARDKLALQRACCAVRLPAALQDAPKPEMTRSRVS